VSPYGSLWAAAAHHRRQPEDAGSGALAAETTNLGVGPLRPLIMRMLHDEGMQPEATSNGLPGHVEQAKSQAASGHSAVGPRVKPCQAAPPPPVLTTVLTSTVLPVGAFPQVRAGFVGATGFEPATARL
jgi:hypothetical protein